VCSLLGASAMAGLCLPNSEGNESHLASAIEKDSSDKLPPWKSEP